MRKRLLEYDDVMNSQREVIYKRRRNALFGDRLQVDIMNMIYDTVEDVVTSAKDGEDYDGLKLNGISVFGVDFNVTKEELLEQNEIDLTEKLYDDVYKHYDDKNEAIRLRAQPIIDNIYKDRGATIEDILVPFTDGMKQIGIASNLVKNIETNCKHLILSLEKMATLSIIDNIWKEHLREMDDLKQSVQNAVYEQKDPLLIYKFEAFGLFKLLIHKVNEDTTSFLMKAGIPIQEPDEVQEARRMRRAKQTLKETKEESRSALESSSSPDTRSRPPVEKMAPVRSQKVAGRNDRVNVQYADGRVLKDIKYKKVEEDILNNKCVIIE
jgi:preprotein translocase subunit SecA